MSDHSDQNKSTPTAGEAARQAAARALLEQGAFKLRRTRHGLMIFNKNDIYIGGALDLDGESNELELRFLGQLIKPGQIVLDVGANIGVHSLHFCRCVGASGGVIAVEPQRIAFQLLCANAMLNGVTNLQTFHAAAAASPGELRIPELDINQRHNFGGVSVSGDEEGLRVRALTVDSLNLRRCHLMKIDVEGFERQVLRGAAGTIARLRPALYVENDRRELSPALLETLFSLDYRLYWHLAPLFNPHNYYGVGRNVFGRVVSVNLLGVPHESGVRVRDLREIKSLDDWWQAPPPARAGEDGIKGG